jgi:hypothetical protein
MRGAIQPNFDGGMIGPDQARALETGSVIAMAILRQLRMQNAAMTRAITVVSCLLFGTLAVYAQDNAVARRTSTEQQPRTATFYCDDPKHDVHSWLKENESYLKRGDGCTLTSSWLNEESPASPSGSVYEIASFVTAPGDEETTRVIRDSDSRSGLDVRLGVRYVPGGPGGSYLLQIALAFEGPPDGVFDEIGQAEAETLRYENWKWLTAVKSVRVGNLRYRFSLRCENGRTFLSFLRRPLKPTPTAKSPRK